MSRPNIINREPLTVAWVSYFPIEWLENAPREVARLPKQHPATWQQVLARELMAVPGLRVHVFVLRKQLNRHLSFQSGNFTFHCLKVPGGSRTLSLFWWDTLLIRSRLRSIRPDLVHAWGSERGAALLASRLPYKYVVSMQGLLQWYQAQNNAGWLPALEARLEHSALRKAKVVTAEATFSVNWLRTHYPHLDVRLIEHGPSWLFQKVDRRPCLNPIRLLFVGSISERKGCDLLLRALEELKSDLQFELRVVGGVAPSFQRFLDATSPELKARMVFRDKLKPEEVADELAQATMAVFPSKADTGPVAVKEAVAAGVPVIGSIMGGIPDYVIPGKNGLLFPSGDLERFVEALRTAFLHPFFSKGLVDLETRSRLQERLAPSTMAASFLALYREQAEGQGS